MEGGFQEKIVRICKSVSRGAALLFAFATALFVSPHGDSNQLFSDGLTLGDQAHADAPAAEIEGGCAGDDCGCSSACDSSSGADSDCGSDGGK